MSLFRTGKRGEGGGEIDSKALGAYGRDVLNENGKLLLRFAEDNKLALLNTFFCTRKSGVSYTFQSANRGKGQARLDYETGGPPTGPLRSIAFSGVSRVGPRPKKDRAKKEKREHQGDSEDG